MVVRFGTQAVFADPWPKTSNLLGASTIRDSKTEISEPLTGPENT